MGRIKIRYKGAWSFSKLRDFETCRAQFARRHIQKLPEAQSAALTWGSEVHEGIEGWFQGWIPKMPGYMAGLAADFKKLKKLNPTLESMWGHDKDWTPLDNGFDRDAWVRAKTDAFLVRGDVAHVIDWKTGRQRDANADQVLFYGVLALLREPKVNKAVLELWYIDNGVIVPNPPVLRDDLKKHLKTFERRAGRIYTEGQWKEEPGLHCRWCPFRKSDRKSVV